MSEKTIREELSREQRSLELELTFDPIYINHRAIHTVFDPHVTRLVDILAARIPADIPEWLRTTRMHHAYAKAVLDLCTHIGVPTLGQLLASGIRQRQIVCSIEQLVGDRAVYEAKAITVRWVPSYETDNQVSMRVNTSYITCDTGRMNLSKDEQLGIVAVVESVQGSEVVLSPLVIGAPWLGIGRVDIDPGFAIEWFAHDFFEHYIEDIDEFALVRNVPLQVDWSQMKRIPEKAIKEFLCERLGEIPRNDWGGEQSDQYSSALHVNGKRMTGAFLLKGPAHFSPMNSAHLGKNGDQIYRLVNEPAELVVVQHSHEVTSSVRATLRAFAVQPGHPRRYCVIDGRDTFRLLQAYDWVDRALSYSK